MGTITAEQGVFACAGCAERLPFEAFANGGRADSDTGDWFCARCEASIADEPPHVASLREAMRVCAGEFLLHRSVLSDLREPFWQAVLAVKSASGSPDPTGEALVRAVGEQHRYLGAPGDFGYETPYGQALIALYRSRNRMIDHLKRSASHPSGCEYRAALAQAELTRSRMREIGAMK